MEQKEVDYQQAKQQLEGKEEKLKSFTGEKLEIFTAEKSMEKERLLKEVNGLTDELAIKKEDVKHSKENLERTKMELKAKEDESTNLKNKLKTLSHHYLKLNIKERN